MIKKILLLIIVTSIAACSSVKKTQEAINYGNYNEAINISLKQLRNNKTKKSNQQYILLLEEAFEKATIKDLEYISFLKKDGNPANFEAIYNSYVNLKNRQEQIKPLLPLPIHSKKRNAQFLFSDYTNEILNAKNKLSEYLYTNAKQLINSSVNKLDYRSAFDDLTYLNKINPNYKDARNLIDEAHFKGTNFVFVSLQNKTRQVIPIRLEKDLLNFNTYNLNDLWTVYHTNKQAELVYDYEMEIIFRDIKISPEQLHEKETITQKQIVDRWKYLKDTNGNLVKDSLGNNIKVDNFKTISCKVKEITQFKSAQVIGQVRYFNLITNQIMESFPLASEFIFEHRYGTYRGDKKALDKKHLDLLNNKFVPFPSNEQMVYDCGEDLKNKIKSSILKNKFRN
jgi:hypothetical protein